MNRYNTPFEIHVHGQVALRPDVTPSQLQEALKPLWSYAGARSLQDGATSAYQYRIKVGVINIPTPDVSIFHLCFISSRLSNCCYP